MLEKRYIIPYKNILKSIAWKKKSVTPEMLIFHSRRVSKTSKNELVHSWYSLHNVGIYVCVQPEIGSQT